MTVPLTVKMTGIDVVTTDVVVLVVGATDVVVVELEGALELSFVQAAAERATTNSTIALACRI